PDGRRLCTAASHQRQGVIVAQVWDVQGGEVVRRLDNFGGVPLEVSPDGRRVLGWDDFQLGGRDADTGRGPFGLPPGDNRYWHAAHFSPDGRHVLTIRQETVQLGGQENYTGRGEVQVWNVADGKPLWPAFRPPNGDVDQADFSPDGQFFVTV